jgi:hypothetical protein
MPFSFIPMHADARRFNGDLADSVCLFAAAAALFPLYRLVSAATRARASAVVADAPAIRAPWTKSGSGFHANLTRSTAATAKASDCGPSDKSSALPSR